MGDPKFFSYVKKPNNILKISFNINESNLHLGVCPCIIGLQAPLAYRNIAKLRLKMMWSCSGA